MLIFQTSSSAQKQAALQEPVAIARLPASEMAERISGQNVASNCQKISNGALYYLEATSQTLEKVMKLERPYFANENDPRLKAYAISVAREIKKSYGTENPITVLISVPTENPKNDFLNGVIATRLMAEIEGKLSETQIRVEIVPSPALSAGRLAEVVGAGNWKEAQALLRKAQGEDGRPALSEWNGTPPKEAAGCMAAKSLDEFRLALRSLDSEIGGKPLYFPGPKGGPMKQFYDPLRATKIGPPALLSVENGELRMGPNPEFIGGRDPSEVFSKFNGKQVVLVSSSGNAPYSLKVEEGGKVFLVSGDKTDSFKDVMKSISGDFEIRTVEGLNLVTGHEIVPKNTVVHGSDPAFTFVASNYEDVRRLLVSSKSRVEFIDAVQSLAAGRLSEKKPVDGNEAELFRKEAQTITGSKGGEIFGKIYDVASFGEKWDRAGGRSLAALFGALDIPSVYEGTVLGSGGLDAWNAPNDGTRPSEGYRYVNVARQIEQGCKGKLALPQETSKKLNSFDLGVKRGYSASFIGSNGEAFIVDIYPDGIEPRFWRVYRPTQPSENLGYAADAVAAMVRSGKRQEAVELLHGIRGDRKGEFVGNEEHVMHCSPLGAFINFAQYFSTGSTTSLDESESTSLREFLHAHLNKKDMKFFNEAMQQLLSQRGVSVDFSEDGKGVQLSLARQGF